MDSSLEEFFEVKVFFSKIKTILINFALFRCRKNYKLTWKMQKVE